MKRLCYDGIGVFVGVVVYDLFVARVRMGMRASFCIFFNNLFLF